jgi:hypothetical protein
MCQTLKLPTQEELQAFGVKNLTLEDPTRPTGTVLTLEGPADASRSDTALKPIVEVDTLNCSYKEVFGSKKVQDNFPCQPRFLYPDQFPV